MAEYQLPKGFIHIKDIDGNDVLLNIYSITSVKRSKIGYPSQPGMRDCLRIDIKGSDSVFVDPSFVDWNDLTMNAGGIDA